MRLRVGTRGSQLALIQTQMVVEAIRHNTPAVQIAVHVIKTEGDRNRHDSLTTLGGRGVFVREIEERLLAGEVDFAVHSLKDLPTTQPAALSLVTVLEREDARDVMISRNHLLLNDLPQRATVGSSSQRRAAQLLALRPDLTIADIRGNVDTRLRKLDDGQYDAIVLAAAGLMRLGVAQRITQYFSPDEMLPAVGQGALVIECRADDQSAIELLAPLDHALTRAAVTAERAFLRNLGSGCQLPIAAFAEVIQDQLHLRGLVAQLDGQRIIRAEIFGEAAQAESLGAQLADQLMRQGVLELMETTSTPIPRPTSPLQRVPPFDAARTHGRDVTQGERVGEGAKPLEGKRIVVTRAREQADELNEKLRALGATPIEWPMIEIAPPEDFAPLDAAIRQLEQYDWVVFSSVNGVKYFFERVANGDLRLATSVAAPWWGCDLRIAAVGVKTAAALQQRGLRVDAVPEEFLASHSVKALGDVRGQKILVLRPDIAPSDLAITLSERGAQVDEVIAYRTLPVRPEHSIALDQVDAVTLASASAAKNFAAHLNGQAVPETVCIACIGPSTTKAARQAGLRVDVEAQVHTLDGLVEALAEYFG